WPSTATRSGSTSGTVARCANPAATSAAVTSQPNRSGRRYSRFQVTNPRLVRSTASASIRSAPHTDRQNPPCSNTAPPRGGAVAGSRRSAHCSGWVPYQTRRAGAATRQYPCRIAQTRPTTPRPARCTPPGATGSGSTTDRSYQTVRSAAPARSASARTAGTGPGSTTATAVGSAATSPNRCDTSAGVSARTRRPVTPSAAQVSVVTSANSAASATTPGPRSTTTVRGAPDTVTPPPRAQ